MKVMIIGHKGMLGTDLMKCFEGQVNLVGVDINDLDITNLDQTIQTLADVMPNVVINSAAYTDVDGCEQNLELAFKVNATGARNIAIACKRIGAAMVQISTDYVFDGKKGEAYKEFDRTNPLSIYGKSKLAGENYVKDILDKFYIVRTSWLYGMNGKNFVTTMLGLTTKMKELNVVNDQIGSPTYTPDLAQAILKLIQKPTYGTFNITNRGHCSWYQYAKEIFAIAGVDLKVNAITTEELNRPAPRPNYSVLDNFCWKLEGYAPLRTYTEALKEYMNKL